MSAARCFHEVDTSVALVRRASAEGLGTMMLAFAASAAGIAASRALPGSVIIVVAFAVAGSLVALIVAFGKLSGGHYNPLITMLQLVAGERGFRCALAYVSAQLAGGLAGGALAAFLWRAVPTASGGAGFRGVASEVVASAGLMLVVFGASRSGRPESGPFAVGAWLVAAIIATPTGSYANPAVVVGATVTAGPIALGATSAVAYAAAEIVGALLALGAVQLLFPKSRETP